MNMVCYGSLKCNKILVLHEKNKLHEKRYNDRSLLWDGVLQCPITTNSLKTINTTTFQQKSDNINECKLHFIRYLSL